MTVSNDLRRASCENQSSISPLAAAEESLLSLGEQRGNALSWIGADLLPIVLNTALERQREAIAMRPERALRADLSVWVVDPFLMRTAENSVHHGHRLGAVLPHESQNFGSNSLIIPEVVSSENQRRISLGSAPRR